jgi:Spy/CpxP family protein refolding chaperone
MSYNLLGAHMRKLAILAAFAAVAGASAAQAQTGGPPDRPRPEGRGPGGRMGPGGPGAAGMLLKGITLSEAQEAQLKAFNDAERAKMQAAGPQGRGGNMEAIRTARESGDTATANRLMRQQRTEMVARRDTQAATIRALLTSDQLTTFDANVAEMKKREAEMGPGGMGDRGRGGRPPQL